MSFASIFKSLVFIFKPIVVATFKEVAQVALAAVVAEVPKLISGQEKFNSAVSTVKTSLESAGKTAAQNVIDVAVQAAYNGLSNLKVK